MTGHNTREAGRAYARLVRDSLGQDSLDVIAHSLTSVHPGGTFGAFHMGVLDVARGILSTPTTAVTTTQ